MNVLSGKGLGLSVLSSVLFALMPVYFAWLAPLDGLQVVALRVVWSLPMVLLLVVLLLCALAHADEEARRLSPLVAEAVETIRNNYMALYGVEDLADALGVSKCHLVRTFSAEMGVSPGKYLTRTRLEAAKLLLLEREYNPDMIASLCGFSGANYLCRVFRREEGLSPIAWRDAAAPHAPAKHLPPRNNEMYV